MMTRILVEIVIYCAFLVVALSSFNLFGLLAVDWVFILVLALVPTMVGIFALAAVAVHEAMATPEDRSKARLRRHHRNWGL